MCGECIKNALPGERTIAVYKKAGIPAKSHGPRDSSIELAFALSGNNLLPGADVYVAKKKTSPSSNERKG